MFQEVICRYNSEKQKCQGQIITKRIVDIESPVYLKMSKVRLLIFKLMFETEDLPHRDLILTGKNTLYL